MTAKKGFTLIELLVTIAIIGIVSGIVMLAIIGEAKSAARDTRRKTDLAQAKQIFVSSCYMPEGGPGEYDIVDLVEELEIKYPQVIEIMGTVPRDPKSGTSEESFYVYMVSEDGRECILYANLERELEQVTLEDLDWPEPGTGTGVLQASEAGWNGSTKYFQIAI